MTNTTTLAWSAPMPNTPVDTLGHLVTRHGWEPRTPDPAMVLAHHYAHGLGGRPDLAVSGLDHTHGGVVPVASAIPSNGRPMTWVIIGWNILMAAWLVYGLVGAGGIMNDCATETYVDACQTGATIGTGIAIVGILFLTAIVDVILAVIWMVTKKD